MVNEDIPFRLVYEGGVILLRNGGLPEEQVSYTQSYLDQVNRYRVIGTHLGSPVFSIYTRRHK